MNDVVAAAPTDLTGHSVTEALTDANFPIFLTRHGPALWPAADPAAGPPAIVLSVPKSGTFFTEALYKRMGYRSVYIHAMDAVCNDRRFDDTDGICFSGLKNIPITALGPLVLPGQIIVSHCGRNAAIKEALSGFKKIYLYRDLRQVFVSHTRADFKDRIPTNEMAGHVAEFCRTRGTNLKFVIEAVSGWRNDRDVLAIDFADLTSANPHRQEALAARFETFMGWPQSAVVSALQVVPSDTTPTRSMGPHSTLDGAWDEHCEAWFGEHMAGVQVVPDRALACR